MNVDIGAQRNRKTNLQGFLFYLALGIYLIISVLNTSLYSEYISGIYKYILVLCFAILALREVLNKLTIKRIGLWVLAGSVVLISFIGNSGANTILTILVFSVAASDLNFDSIATFAYKLLLFCLLFVISSSKIGIITDYVYYMSGEPRHYLGFLYALQPAGLMLELVILNLYTHRRKKRNRGLILLFALGVFIWRMTKSRLTFFLEIIIIIFDFLYRRKKKIVTNKMVLAFEKVSYPLCAVLSFYFALTYENSSWKTSLNSFLANRMGLAKASIEKYGIHLFGQKISWYGLGLNQEGERTLENVWNGYDWVDNSYVQLFQLYGAIIACIFIIIVTVAVIHMIKDKQYYLAAAITVYSVHGMIDTASLTLMYNLFWLAIFGSIIGVYRRYMMKEKIYDLFHKAIIRIQG